MVGVFALVSVSAKVLRPRVGARALARSRLIGVLDGMAGHRVAVVTAPAGFGKSWLVSDWLDWHADWYQGWVTIDAHDRDPLRFWSHIVEAVPFDFDGSARELMAEGRVGIPRIVDALVADLTERGEPTVLVLDDVHLLEGDESLRSVDQLLQQLPEDVHVILIGRSDPDLRLAKWRLAGDLLDISAQDLQCTIDEAEELVSRTLGLGLSPDVIARLHSNTLGWIAGIRLAAMATARSSDMHRAADAVPDVGSLDGAYDVLGDYLVEEVLDDLKADDRQFLLETSILTDLPPDVCDAVTERTDSAEVLARLLRSGMFITRVGDSDDRFRYHDVFRDALRTVLQRSDKTGLGRLHRRAADWFHRNAMPVDAIEHAIAATDMALAGDWVVEASHDLLKSNQAETLRGLIERLDAESEDLPLSVLAVWMHATAYNDVSGDVINGVLERMISSIRAVIEENDEEVLRRMAGDELIHATPAEYLQRIIATLGRRTGDIDAVLAAVEALDHASYGGRTEAAAGRVLVYLGQFSAGMKLSRVGHEIVFSPRNLVAGSRALAMELQAWAAIGEGRLGDARTLSGRAVGLMEQLGLGNDPPAAVATVPLAWVAYERGEITTSLELIVPVMGRLERYGDVPAHVRACILLARLEHVRGNRAEAADLLLGASVTSKGNAVTGYFGDLLAFESARLALLDDDLAAAQVALPDWRERSARGARTMTEHFLLARFLLVAGEDLGHFLDAEPERVDSTPVHAIESHKMRSLAALRDGEPSTSIDELTAAMTIASRTGHVQSFLDDADAFGPVMQNAIARSGHHIPFYGQMDAPRFGAGVVHSSITLTARELDVLALLPSHLTYNAMAEALFLSPNTIKAYIKSIYRKLGTQTRSGAVETARSLGLIASSTVPEPSARN